MEKIKEILEFDERLTEYLTSFKGVYLNPGSVLRVPSYAWGDWGIELTDDNIEELYYLSQKAYEKEWGETDASLNKLVGVASVNAGLGDVNADMNNLVGKIAASFLADISSDKELRVLDIGAGTGATTLATLRAMISIPEKWKTLLDRTKFILVEPSEKRVLSILDSIENDLHMPMRVADSIEFQFCKDIDIDVDPNSINIVISNAAIHHNAVLDRSLRRIAETMKEGAMFVNGDWHNDVWHDPIEFAVKLYPKLLSLEGNDLDSFFKGYFELFAEGSRPSMFLDMYMQTSLNKSFYEFALKFCELYPHTKAQKIADDQIIQFWVSVNNEFKKESENRGEKVTATIDTLESHEPIPQRKRTMAVSGIETDSIKVQEMFQHLKRTGKYVEKGNVHRMIETPQGISDLAAVMVAGKRNR
ncbi:class I SAM-dependent methyltransferase [Candidatus Micrarchaeota archaeon]|jgi:SAM-dependent methyltransferase|nr:class I SAM-dependent methyltransferase [Candidatus Micrarchaeota archaeon]